MRVLFVCLGNICRSPTAEAVMQTTLEKAGLHHVDVESAGTSSLHRGEAPDKRSQMAAKKRGYDMSGQRARQVIIEDFYEFDFILAMDASNLAFLEELNPGNGKAKVDLFLKYHPQELRNYDVPDPYWGGKSGFEKVLDLIEGAAHGLLPHLQGEKDA